jgi:hypothetical protein
MGRQTASDTAPRIMKVARQPKRRMHHMTMGTRSEIPAIEATDSALTAVPRRLTNQRASVADATTCPVAARPRAASTP